MYVMILQLFMSWLIYHFLIHKTPSNPDSHPSTGASVHTYQGSYHRTYKCSGFTTI
jgi:hypothetical protein